MANFNIRAWYKGAVAAAVALLGVGAVAHEPALILFAVGLLLLGLGEWINHPFHTEIIPPGYGFPTGGIASGEVRRPKAFGLLLDLVGFGFFSFGLFRLVESAL